MLEYYIEVEGKPVKAKSGLDWARNFEIANRRVDFTKTLNGEISTVFLGIDHSLGCGPPLLYETIVFGGTLDQEQDRYSTREQAVAGHADMISKVKSPRQWLRRLLRVFGISRDRY